MNTTMQFYEILRKTDSHLKARKSALKLLSLEPDCLVLLLRYTFKEGDAVQPIASYLLLDLLQQNWNLLVPHCAYFIKGAKLVKNESVKRIVSRIFVLAIEKKVLDLTVKQKEIIGNYALGWLVDNSKVATESNAMDILMYFRVDLPTLFQMGREMITVNFYARSIAYQSKAKKYLALCSV